MHIKCIVAVIASFFVLSATAQAAVFIDLTSAGQGEGDKGPVFRPVDDQSNPASVVMTAQTNMWKHTLRDADAAGDVGHVDIIAEGAGVIKTSGEGSQQISREEHILFSFDGPVYLNSIQIALGKFTPGNGTNDKDEPLLFFSFAGTDEYQVFLDEEAIMEAYTSTGPTTGLVDFSLFGFGPDTVIDSLILRARYQDGFTASSLRYEAVDEVIPEPATATLLLAGLGTLILRPRR